MAMIAALSPVQGVRVAGRADPEWRLKKAFLAFFSSQSKKRGPVIQGALLHFSNTWVFEK